jgi:hypothetical protein
MVMKTIGVQLEPDIFCATSRSATSPALPATSGNSMVIGRVG